MEHKRVSLDAVFGREASSYGLAVEVVWQRYQQLPEALRSQDGSPDAEMGNSGLMWMNASDGMRYVVRATAGLAISFNSKRQMQAMFGSEMTSMDEAIIRSFRSQIREYQTEFGDEQLQTAGGNVLRQLWQEITDEEWEE